MTTDDLEHTGAVVLVNTRTKRQQGGDISVGASAAHYQRSWGKSVSAIVAVVVVLLSTFFLTAVPGVQAKSGLVTNSSTNTVEVEAFDPVQHIMCMFGNDSVPAKMYQMAQSDDQEFKFRSKSSLNGGIDNVDDGLNAMLSIFGHDFNKTNSQILGRSVNGYQEEKSSGKKADAEELKFNGGKQVNPFDRFGVSGLNFTGYLGEWRYVVINACDEEPEPQDPKANVFYDGRLEPQSSYEDIPTSKDIRTQQFDKGTMTHLNMSVNNAFVNFFFLIPKFAVTITSSLINMTFADLNEMFGLNKMMFGNNYNGGMFQSLKDSLYTPLIAVVFVFTASVFIYKALFRQRYREGVTDLARVFAMMILAVLIFANPAKFLAVPNNLAVGIQATMVSAMNTNLTTQGEMCSTNVGGSYGKDKISLFNEGDRKKLGDRGFISNVSKNMGSSVGCTLWENFLLRPWAQGQYGANWTDLWAKGKIPEWSKENNGNELNNDNSSWVGDAGVPLGGGKFINNWAIFQISAQTNVHSPISHQGEFDKTSNGASNDWWRIVDAVSNYTETGERIQTSSPSKSDNASGSSNPSGKWVKPVDGTMSSGYGPRSLGDFHKGIDFGEKCGSPIYAAGDGVVRFVGKEAMGGEAILIEHKSDNVSTLYVHMQPNTHKVKEGDNVKAGDRISSVGESGMAFGCHLHFEVRKPASSNWADFDHTTDPQKFLKDAGVDVGKSGSDASGKNPDGSSSGGDDGKSGGDDDGKSGGGDVAVSTVIPNEPDPTPYWASWTASSPGSRMGAVASSILVSIVGLAGPFVLALFTAMTQIGINILMWFTPVMLLFGSSSGRLWKVFQEWFKLIVVSVLLRIFLGFLTVLSIIVLTTILGKMATLGWWRTTLFLALASLAFWKSRKYISTFLRGLSFAGGSFQSTASQVASSITNGVGGVGRVATTSVSGAVNSRAHGGSFVAGGKAGAKTELTNLAYKNRLTRNAMVAGNAAYQSSKHKGRSNVGDENCLVCGLPINQDNLPSYVYGTDPSGNLICQNCLDGGFAPAGTREFIADSRKKIDERENGAAPQRQQEVYSRRGGVDRNGGNVAEQDIRNMGSGSKNYGLVQTVKGNSVDAKKTEARNKKLMDDYQKQVQDYKSGKTKNAPVRPDLSQKVRQDIYSPEATYDALIEEVKKDIRTAQIADLKKNEIVAFEIPDELKPYLNESTMKQAWIDGQFEYISAASAMAWLSWYNDNIYDDSKKLTLSADEAIAKSRIHSSFLDEHEDEEPDDNEESETEEDVDDELPEDGKSQK